MTTTFTVNGTKHALELRGHETLLEVLRGPLGLTGTKTACEDAECGACTVSINGRTALACIRLAADVEGASVTTIEGLADGDELHPVQEAFIEKGAVQCGFCMPGMIMASKDLLDRNPEPSKEEIERALDGNICRCAGYPKVIEAVQLAGKRMRKKE